MGLTFPGCAPTVALKDRVNARPAHLNPRSICASRYDPMISSFPVVDTEKLKEVHDHEASHGVPFTPEECREACWRPGEGWGEKKVMYALEESSTNQSGYEGVGVLPVSNASGSARKKRYNSGDVAGTFLFPEEAALCRAAGGRHVLCKVLRQPWCDREHCCKKY